MLPVLAIPYFVDCYEAYAKLLGYLRAAHLSLKLFDLGDFLSGQFGEMGLFSDKQWRFTGFQDPNRVNQVFSWGDYFEIFYASIIAYSIFVIYHLIGRYRPDKGFGYKPMHTFYAAFTSKTHAWVMRIIAARFHDSFSRALHPSLVADLISGESLNRFPFFCHVDLLFRCTDSMAGFMEAA